MNILTINKFYYIKGGSETYLFALKRELENIGHKVIPFAMKDNKNYPTEYEDYFVDHIDYGNAGFLEKIKLGSKVIYSQEARRNLERLLDVTHIDVAHLHLFQHQLSPSILIPLKKRKIPVIYTVHDLKVMCPNYKMLHKNQICEKCKDGKFYNVMLNRCTKNSLSGSLISMLEAYLHHGMKVYEEYIDHFITPSQFYKDKMIEWGFPQTKISYIPNFLDTNSISPSYLHKDYMLYLGRLSEEKGILTLLEAMKKISGSAKLKIAGTGPLTDLINDFINQNGLEEKVEMLGFISGSNLEQIISNAKCVIMPSEWYENGPLALIETFASGKPVIGSNIGGIPEHIDNGINGYLFEAKNSDELASKIDIMQTLPEKNYLELCQNARKKAEYVFDAKNHLSQILPIYRTITA
ncbi:glycosyltransferase family 4 protein [Paenibacillus pasadenensis]|uniref:glycosyltransferase family 4 protein n=1 Tax=Paenibacillus pasadenensis TaxID=217090 RepID=UPI00203BA268|nr:glycosyltransferase family 4 protein [Paenibacillus pasadenensis]MCM3749152.1 glycosyltransferase family 4 protein [Paenibacillus pasadenensis]